MRELPFRVDTSDSVVLDFEEFVENIAGILSFISNCDGRFSRSVLSKNAREPSRVALWILTDSTRCKRVDLT